MLSHSFRVMAGQQPVEDGRERPYVFDGLLPGHDSGRKWFNVTGISSKDDSPTVLRAVL